MLLPEEVCGEVSGADQADEQQPPIELGAREQAKQRFMTRASCDHVAMPGAARRMTVSCVASSRAQDAGLPALAHHQDAVGQQQQLRHLRRHHDDAEPLRGELEDQPVDLLLGADVDAARRLVEQQDARLGRQPFADHDLLLVAAGERGGCLIDAGAADREPLDHVGGERALRGRSARRPNRDSAPIEGSATLSQIEAARCRPRSLRSSLTSATPSGRRRPAN